MLRGHLQHLEAFKDGHGFLFAMRVSCILLIAYWDYTNVHQDMQRDAGMKIFEDESVPRRDQFWGGMKPPVDDLYL